MSDRKPYPSEEEVAASLAKVRELALGLPEMTERVSHGAPSWFVRDKKLIATFYDDHHDDGMLALWTAAPDGVQATLIETEPERFFRPPYVGHRGWIGVRLDVDVEWDEIAQILEDAYRCVAPKKLISELDGLR